MIQKGLRQGLENATIPVIAVILGLLVSSIFVFLAQSDPVQTYQRLFCEGFGPRGCETFGDLIIFHPQADDGTT